MTTRWRRRDESLTNSAGDLPARRGFLSTQKRRERRETQSRIISLAAALLALSLRTFVSSASLRFTNTRRLAGELRLFTSSPTVLVVLLCLAVWCSAAEVQLTDANGKPHTPLRSATNKATVILFTLPDCPIANAFAPEINRLVADYSSRGVGFYLAHADRDVTAAAARQHAADFAFRCPVLLDPQHALVHALGATKTPQAFLIDAAGKTVYRGRINNLFAEYGTRRQVVTKHDLRAALDAVLAGKPVAQPVTEAIGCHIQTTVTNTKP